MDIGHKIKEKRMILGLTQEELANRCELTKGYISLLENNKTDPSIQTLETILEVLGITLSDFFKVEEEEKIVFSPEEQLDKEFIGYIQSWLVPSAQMKAMEPIYIELDSHNETVNDSPHAGEEFGYVFEGEINVHYGNKIYKCSEGESFYYVADRPHYLSNTGKKKAKIVWVSCPPNF